MVVKERITEKQVKQLILYTNADPEIQRYTDDLKRFSSKETFDKWLLKKRIIYTLSDNADDLLGIIWFGKEKLTKDYTNTFAIRTYGGIRNKGSARWFMGEAFDQYILSDKYDGGGFWLEVHKDNLPALKLYKNFGFREYYEAQEKIVMTLKINPNF